MEGTTSGTEGTKEISKSNPLKYDGLQFKDSIRILKLEAALTDDAELYASFVEVKLSEGPSYEAISYTWGAPVFSETLHFQSSRVNITESLASALRSFRLKDRERILWADAVCINQKDDVEKGAQVAMMGDIYQRASHVLIWLGHGSPKLGHAIKGFEILADELITSNASQKRWDPQILDYEMNLVYDRAWFSRLWTVQEVALAARATLFCGRHELEWPRFAAVMVLLKSHLLRTHAYMRNPETILGACSVIETRALYQLLSSSQKDASTAQLSHFNRIVEIIRSQKCTDDRDRIYGLLNLRPPGASLTIQPDYSKPVSFVYLDY
ncbi:HET-domain-containing protein, partial [Bimuria novae-zelandiae CBS 107.79]